MSARRVLTVLDDRRGELETCGYCPKLCRATCPVSEAESSEALTPWGKMTLTWYEARGDLAPDRDLAALAWGCTGCLGCRERCAHKNPLVPTLEAARGVAHRRGLAPPGSERALRAFTNHRARAHGRRIAPDPKARAVLVTGCGYAERGGRELDDARRVAAVLAGPVAEAEGCCGLVARLAGDEERARIERRALLAEVRGRTLLVADAGCALELRDEGAVTLAELGASRLDRVERLRDPPPAVRYHDPCRLARGLGVVEEPRSILEKALGAPAAEFERNREGGACSGAGGLLPFALPRAARTIARGRIAEHERLGGGTIVTACSASLAWFRAQGASAVDLVTILARGVSNG
ncbi:MAG TPA: (Fe-S)-binding protein [Polyangiaceae bacterium]|nr:(Fe-S)-binding protein [Polyangiaceae bacterium]